MSEEREARDAFEVWWVRSVPERYRADALGVLQKSRYGDGKYGVGRAQESWEGWDAALEWQSDRATAQLSNLLARIYRDGGHYEAEHGTEKAEAEKRIAELNGGATGQEPIYQAEESPGIWRDISKSDFDKTHHARIVYAAPISTTGQESVASDDLPHYTAKDAGSGCARCGYPLIRHVGGRLCPYSVNPVATTIGDNGAKDCCQGRAPSHECWEECGGTKRRAQSAESKPESETIANLRAALINEATERYRLEGLLAESKRVELSDAYREKIVALATKHIGDSRLRQQTAREMIELLARAQAKEE